MWHIRNADKGHFDPGARQCFSCRMGGLGSWSGRGRVHLRRPAAAVGEPEAEHALEALEVPAALPIGGPLAERVGHHERENELDPTAVAPASKRHQRSALATGP